MSSEYTARLAWETTDRETRKTVQRWKTVRRDDGVVIGEHVEERLPWGSVSKTVLWGTCDTDHKMRETLELWGVDMRLSADAERNNDRLEFLGKS